MYFLYNRIIPWYVKSRKKLYLWVPILPMAAPIDSYIWKKNENNFQMMCHFSRTPKLPFFMKKRMLVLYFFHYTGVDLGYAQAMVKWTMSVIN